jgi:hypothetical protein
VAHGRIRKMRMTIYCDQTSEDAPIDRNANVQVLAHVEADVSHIPEHLLNRRQGKDGQMYYDLSCKIEAVYLSASTTYTLLYNSMCFPSFSLYSFCFPQWLLFGLPNSRLTLKCRSAV